jgi:predicted nucleotidyltransferase
MNKKLAKGSCRWYYPPHIPMFVIRRFARQIAEQFHPEKIVLFGSFAYGRPNADSDVDILVVMPARNQLSQAARISVATQAPFPLDIIVRTPDNLRWRLQEGDSFLQEIMAQGKVLYEKTDRRMGAKSRSRLQRSKKLGTKQGSAP